MAAFFRYSEIKSEFFFFNGLNYHQFMHLDKIIILKIKKH